MDDIPIRLDKRGFGQERCFSCQGFTGRFTRGLIFLVIVLVLHNVCTV